MLTCNNRTVQFNYEKTSKIHSPYSHSECSIDRHWLCPYTYFAYTQRVCSTYATAMVAGLPRYTA